MCNEKAFDKFVELIEEEVDKYPKMIEEAKLMYGISYTNNKFAYDMIDMIKYKFQCLIGEDSQTFLMNDIEKHPYYNHLDIVKILLLMNIKSEKMKNTIIEYRNTIERLDLYTNILQNIIRNDPNVKNIKDDYCELEIVQKREFTCSLFANKED